MFDSKEIARLAIGRANELLKRGKTHKRGQIKKRRVGQVVVFALSSAEKR